MARRTPRRRKRVNTLAKAAVIAATLNHPAPRKPRRRPRRRRAATAQGGNAYGNALNVVTGDQAQRLMYRGNEYLTWDRTGSATSGEIHQFSFCPGRSGLPRLDSQGIRWEKWRLVRLRYVFNVNTVPGAVDANGHLSASIDPDATDVALSESALLIHQPNIRAAYHLNATITVRPQDVMQQKHLFTAHGAVPAADSISHNLNVFTSGNHQSAQSVRVEYVVEFIGPCATTQAVRTYTMAGTSAVGPDGSAATQTKLVKGATYNITMSTRGDSGTTEAQAKAPFESLKGTFDNLNNTVTDPGVQVAGDDSYVYRVVGKGVANAAALALPVVAALYSELTLQGAFPDVVPA